MKSRIVRFGSSWGIPIPEPLLERSGLSGEVEIEVHDGMILVRSIPKPREGWGAAFEQMAAAGDDELLDAGIAPDVDDFEWEWEES